MDIELKHSVKSHFKYYDTLEKIISRVKDCIPKFEVLKLNPEFTLLVCNIIEKTVRKKDNVAKMQLAKDVMKDLFELTEDEVKQIETQILFLHQNGKIKKISVRKWVYEWGKKNLLSRLGI